MNNINVRTGLFITILLAGFAQQALSETPLIFEDVNGQKLPCGNVANLTVNSDAVTAKGSVGCLAVAVEANVVGPTAEPHNLGTVNTNDSGSTNVTDKAVVTLPLPSAPVRIVTQPSLPGATATVAGGMATYNAPSSEDITANAVDSFTYAITDATGQTSNPATVDVNVNWVAVKSDGCAPSSTIVCMGETPGWPVFHENVAHYLAGGTTHVWSFVYESPYIGSIAPVLSIGNKNLKISETPGDTAMADLDCWRDFGEYVLFEPAGGGDIYRCDLKVGYRYYFNIRNLDSTATTYELKGDGYY